VLIAGGLFLLYKGTREIHHGLEGDGQKGEAGGGRTSFARVVAQIMLLDIVFSLDSVITPVGGQYAVGHGGRDHYRRRDHARGIKAPCRFRRAKSDGEDAGIEFPVANRQTLVANGAGFDVPKGYIYAAIGFSVAVETLNQLAARRRR